MSKKKKHGHRNERKHRIKLFLTYFVILIIIAAMLEMITFGALSQAFQWYRPVILSLIGAIIFTFAHDHMGERSQIDDIADF